MNGALKRLSSWLVLGALVLGAAAHAAPKRYAVVVGHNRSARDATILRFAESDAGKFARVLTEVGDVAPEDVFLVLGRNSREVQRAFSILSGRIAEHRTGTRGGATVFFYFAGHSDGAFLELGDDRLAISELRALLANTGADLKLAVLDACKTGASLLARGLEPVERFDLSVQDAVQARGEVFISSSAADEVALESEELGGGIFTQAFVSGLRGAADRSGDGRVTLAETYDYAFSRTVAESGKSLHGTQHPSYRLELSGTGELVLTRLRASDAVLLAPPGFEQMLVYDLVRGQVVAEIRQGSAPALSLASGRYEVLVRRRGDGFRGEVSLAKGQRHVLTWEALRGVKGPASVSRGRSFLLGSRAQLFALVNAAPTLGLPRTFLPGLSVVWYGGGEEGWTFGADTFFLPQRSDDSRAEYAASGRVGYRWEWHGSLARLGAGLSASAGGRWQRLGAGAKGFSPTLALAPVASVRRGLWGPTELLLELRPSLLWLKLDGRGQLRFSPEAGAGLGVRW